MTPAWEPADGAGLRYVHGYDTGAAWLAAVAEAASGEAARRDRAGPGPRRAGLWRMTSLTVAAVATGFPPEVTG